MSDTVVLNQRFESFRAFIREYSSKLSEVGLFVETDSPAPVGSPVEMDFRLNDDFRLFHGRGEVAWAGVATEAEGQPKGMAIRFTEMDDAGRQLIAKMTENQSRRGGTKFDMEDSLSGVGPVTGTSEDLTAEESESDAPERKEWKEIEPPSSDDADLLNMNAEPAVEEFDLAATSPADSFAGAVDSDDVATSEQQGEAPDVGGDSPTDFDRLVGESSEPFPDLLADLEDSADSNQGDQAELPLIDLPGTTADGAVGEAIAESEGVVSETSEEMELDLPPIPPVAPEETLNLTDAAGIEDSPEEAEQKREIDLRAWAGEREYAEFDTTGVVVAKKARSRRPLLLLLLLILAATAAGIIYRDRLGSMFGGEDGSGSAAVPAEQERPFAAAEEALAVEQPMAEQVQALPETEIEEPLQNDALAVAATGSDETQVPEPEITYAEPDTTEATGTPFTGVDRLTWSEEGDTTVVSIWTDGAVAGDRLEALRVVGNPPRTVIKVFGIEQRFPSSTIPVGTALIERLRTGIHEVGDGLELHVVADLADANATVLSVRTEGRRIDVLFGR